MDYEDPILIDVNSKRNKRQSILCVICKGVQLKEVEERVYKCPKCKNTYQLGYEILEHEDDFESSHENEDIELSGLSDNNDSVGLLTANDNDDYYDKKEEEITTNSDIPIPSYFKPGPGQRIEFREIIEED